MKNPNSRCCRKSRRPGGGPLANPMWPPPAAARADERETSCDRGKARRWHERIVQRVEDEVRHAHAAEPRLARRTRPVVFGIAESVHRRGVRVVVLMQHCGGRAIDRHRAMPGKRAELCQRLRLSVREEHARVEPVEAAPQRHAASRQVERLNRSTPRLRRTAHPPRARRATWPARCRRARCRRRAAARRASRVQAPQDPVGLVGVARVVRARQQVGFAAAAAEVRHQRAPAAVGRSGA